jgi:hypothetical protein
MSCKIAQRKNEARKKIKKKKRRLAQEMKLKAVVYA